ncbi:large subunit ribosomal protein L10 [Desulfosalsimonas propionicica]|uniref:Large ribosomal subunit protein uL10 n=1 Tax=Desulfosalsimonas propionicica TaxID=332175 RepID=A0A7W0CA06_9BACT|nr:large subunit ribosomal protein L10 [Desulfosalsimonas propionicica]
MLTLSQKQELVSALHEKFEQKKILVLVDYKGLNVTKINDLRSKLRQAGIEFKVVKNTLLIRAAEQTDVELLRQQFEGPSAVAMSYDDPVAPAKVLCEFAKDNDKLQIKAGIMDGSVLDADGIKRLSELPSREVLLATVLGTMNAVPTGLVRALNNVPERLVYALKAINDQKEAA